MPDNVDSVGKLYGRSLGPSLPVGQISTGTIEVPGIQGGMFKGQSRDKLPATSGQVLRNARVREDWTGRRPGTAVFGGAKPDTHKILGLVTYIAESGDVYICRITSNTFHVLNAAIDGWTSYSVVDKNDSGTTFTADTRFTYAQFFDKLYIADGVNRIWECDFGHQKVRELAEAPRAQFIMSYAERIIGANIDQFVGGVRPSSVAWPINSDPRDWTGFGSGNEDLAVQNIGDHISGVVPMENNALIIRKSSIWLMSRQPFQAPTFRFTRLMEGIGCDLPYTIARVPGGVIFADQRTKEVYFFSPTDGPQNIGSVVNEDIYSDLQELETAQGVYDPFEKEYHLGIVHGAGQTNITRVWVFNLENRAWSYDDSPEISTLGVVSVPNASLAIDDLTGTIDAQSGTINDYGGEGDITPSLFKGTDAGVVMQQSFSSDDDHDASAFEFEFQSQNLGSLSNRRSIKDLRVSVTAPSGGTVTLEEQNQDLGWPVTVANTMAAVATNQAARIPKKGITGEDLWWRVRSTAPQLKVFSWLLRMLEKGLQR